MKNSLFDVSSTRILFKLAWLALIVACGLAAWIVAEYFAMPAVSKTGSSEETVATLYPLPAPSIETGFDWSVFRKMEAASSDSEKSDLASRFDLVGTYFVYDEVMNNRIRKAIVDDLQSETQHVVGEKDMLADGILVKSIFRERIILQQDGNKAELWLSFAGKGREETAGGEDSGVDGDNRFGAEQLGKSRWAFDRSALLDYYQELRDRPERLVQVFDSFDPLYSQSGDITGYEIGIEGEEELFEAAGLRNGDVVREVNSMKMSSRRRAEFFIHEFAKGRANAFVIEIERDGKEQRMVYRVK